MLDRKFIIENADKIKKNCQQRGVTCDVDRLIVTQHDSIEAGAFEQRQHVSQHVAERAHFASEAPARAQQARL